MEISKEFKEYLDCRMMTAEAAVIALMEFLKDKEDKTVWVSQNERRVLIVTK